MLEKSNTHRRSDSYSSWHWRRWEPDQTGVYLAKTSSSRRPFTGTNSGRTELVIGYKVSKSALKSLLGGDWLTDGLIFAISSAFRIFPKASECQFL